ncbi:FCRLA protein, partial [Drymodes brunneopygia]|nr:FCRLA protein [Drymodes brunneopygia]NXU42541.1 FCRLA protein [Drymodes brunneopygia]
TGPVCPPESLVLQAPARALLEGDTVTLRCRVRQDNPVTGMRFYHEEKALGGPFRRTELSLSLLQLHHSGRYRCGGLLGSGMSRWHNSAPATVTVHGEHPHSRH